MKFEPRTTGPLRATSEPTRLLHLGARGDKACKKRHKNINALKAAVNKAWASMAPITSSKSVAASDVA
ncbi:Hypothetical protein FKW44_025348 [Caligus rogercresseyi]|uniref:Uncharacterized protein n=1 Tax=Caligus rogercresseyi TaxID=217165 RepID=A0A7T8GL80_CALRO|nr:Hypothetical protein FKW44_025348 [Caligus rogercresseyi]